jgi:hypothetical protein
MTFCTIVEFEWNETFDRERFESMIKMAGGDQPPPEGCLSRIAGVDDKGARIIEVWRSSDDATAHAENTAPDLSAGQWPAPSRVFGFDVTSYDVS